MIKWTFAQMYYMHNLEEVKNILYTSITSLNYNHIKCYVAKSI